MAYLIHKIKSQRLFKNIIIKKNKLTAAFSLACLEIRLTCEEALNSNQSRIYSLKVNLYCILIDVDTFY